MPLSRLCHIYVMWGMKAFPAEAIRLYAAVFCEELASFSIWFSDISIQTR